MSKFLSYDAAPDGRLLMIQRSEQELSSREITVVVFLRGAEAARAREPVGPARDDRPPVSAGLTELMLEQHIAFMRTL
jgi:hypothetical protein